MISLLLAKKTGMEEGPLLSSLSELFRQALELLLTKLCSTGVVESPQHDIRGLFRA